MEDEHLETGPGDGEISSPAASGSGKTTEGGGSNLATVLMGADKKLTEAQQKAIEDVQRDMKAKTDAAKVVAANRMKFTNNRMNGSIDPRASTANNIIANVTEMFYGKSTKMTGPPPLLGMPPIPPPPFMGPPPMDAFFNGRGPPPGMPLPPPPGMMMPPPLMGPPILPPPTSSSPLQLPTVDLTNLSKRKLQATEDDQPKRVRLSMTDSVLSNGEDETEEENELFVKLLFKKLRGIKNKQRLENLHMDIMSMVKRAADEDSIDKGGSWHRLT